VIINKSISILNDGVGSAGVLVSSGGNGITINAGATDVVNLRGLVLEGSGVGTHGIVLNSAKSLNIQNSVVRNMAGDAVIINPNQASISKLNMRDVLIADNAGTGLFISVAGTGTFEAVLNRVESDNNSNGMVLNTGFNSGKITATGCVFSNNAGTGASISGITTAASLMLISSVSANNGDGVTANGANATIRLGWSVITGNANGWTTTNSGSVKSYGDNKIDGNTANEAAPPVIPDK
jgi:hypothetical protein